MDSNRHDWLDMLLQQALKAQTARLNSCNHLSQLKDVLLAINDLESAARQPCAHITGVQPALPIQHFPSLLLILQVPLENGGAPDTDLQLGHEYQHPMQMNQCHTRYLSNLPMQASQQGPSSLGYKLHCA